MKKFGKATATCFSFVVLLQFLWAPAWAEGKVQPMTLVEKTVNSVIATLKDKNLCCRAKQDKVLDLMYARFDFEEMSRRILARNWKKLSSEQKRRFVDLFSRLLGISYYKKMEGYTDETVVYQRQIIRGKYAMVETLVKTHDTDIPINYKLIYKNGNWYVYDVKIEGVSLVSNYRTSYNTIIRKNGVDALLKTMEEKLKELESGSAKVDNSKGSA